MSNAKIRHWVYTAIGLLILFGGAWWLLMRNSKYTADYVKQDLFSYHANAYQDVSAYLQEKEIIAHITAIPTIDQTFGIPTEDTDLYRNCNAGFVTLFNSESVAEIISDGDAVQFITPKSGGLLRQEYVIIVCGEAPPILKGAPQNAIPGTAGKWFYYVVKAED